MDKFLKTSSFFFVWLTIHEELTFDTPTQGQKVFFYLCPPVPQNINKKKKLSVFLFLFIFFLYNWYRRFRLQIRNIKFRFGYVSAKGRILFCLKQHRHRSGGWWRENIYLKTHITQVGDLTKKSFGKFNENKIDIQPLWLFDSSGLVLLLHSLSLVYHLPI